MDVWSKNMVPLRNKTNKKNICFRQTSRYILNIGKRLISPNSNPPTLTHPSAFRRAQTEADV